MALQLKISVKEDKDCIVVQECTGKYSGTNKRGYNIPNVTVANVTAAQLEIYRPEQTTPQIINVFPDYPTDDTELGYEVLAAALGVSKIESGVWKIGYRVSGVDKDGKPFEKYTESKEVFLKTAQCCVDKAKASAASDWTNKDKKKAASELEALMTDAEWAKCCGKFNAAQDILKYINLQCECCN